MKRNQIMLLEGAINYDFMNPSLLVQALTTKAFSNENNSPFRDSLATLGDGIHNVYWVEKAMELGLTEKGDISKYRESWVNHKEQADLMHNLIISMNINPQELFKMSKGENQNQIFTQENFLEMAFEALLGAVYLDSNFTRVKEMLDYIYL